jgi:hypothetical protein
MSTAFELIGHDCPYDSYPAPVIPIGELNGELVAVYPGGDPGPVVEPVARDSKYTKHPPALQQKLAHFDMWMHRLFAYTPDEVECYPIAEEREFLGRFLARDEYCNSSQAIRKLLAQRLRHASGSKSDIQIPVLGS